MNSNEWVIVRAPEGSDVSDVRDQLAEAGFDVEIVVAVKAEQAESAQRALDGMEGEADPSASLDLETVAVFHGIDGEMQAAAVQGLLEQAGISVVVEGAYGLPSLPYEVKVASSLVGSAREILARAEEGGRAAADAESALGK